MTTVIFPLWTDQILKMSKSYFLKNNNNLTFFKTDHLLSINENIQAFFKKENMHAIFKNIDILL